MAFGGLGCNIFNPALVGRVFLLISFPVAMTTWPLPGGIFAGADGATGATILARMKMGELDAESLSYVDMLLGNMGGSIGEVGAIALLIGFVYLLFQRVISWHIPVAIVATVAVLDLLIGAPIGVNLLSGGLLLGAIFMATDYVTSPMTHRGMIIYGVLIGVVTVVIRQWGVYPEGMSFAILIGNAVTPLINRWIRPTRFAERRSA
jgi:electron transport complex protein RnfD